ncbi:hypothetical protein [Natrialba taiwanensis]|nr:hypothetical protein [Natrialba taiwanensis]
MNAVLDPFTGVEPPSVGNRRRTATCGTRRATTVAPVASVPSETGGSPQL